VYLTCTDGEGLPYTDIEKANVRKAIKQGAQSARDTIKREKKG